MYVWLFYSPVSMLIQSLTGEFIVNIMNVIIAWLVPSLSECVQPPTMLLLPLSVPHYEKGDVYARLTL